MDISFIRSSSFNTYDLCQMQYFLVYILGWQEKTGVASTKGTIVHKALELLAKAKLAEQCNIDYFTDDTLGNKPFSLIENDIHTNETVDYFYDKSFDYYLKKEQSDFTDKERRECHRWVYKVIDDGFYDPRKLNIVYPEKKFDIPIEKDWAKLSDGEYLRVKGTIDLTLRSNNTYEICDWKTGKRKNWATGNYKTNDDLQDDFQLRLYHYAIRKLYPDIKDVLVTINYINDGGPVTVAFDDSNFEITESKIHSQFVKIKNCIKPKRKQNGQHWFCKRVCSFGKNKHNNGQQTQCEFITNNLKLNSMSNTVQQHTAKGFKIDYYEDPG